MANVLSCDIVESEFELESRYYVHFAERYELPYLPSYRLNCITTVFLFEGLQGHYLFRPVSRCCLGKKDSHSEAELIGCLGFMAYQPLSVI